MGEGDPVVLLPPSGQSSIVHADLMRYLSQRYLVVGLDPPGWGRSDPLPAGATIKDIGTWLAQALESLGLQGVNLYGLHTGNKLATALAVSAKVSVRKLAIAGLSHSLIPDPKRRRQLFLEHVPSLAAGRVSNNHANTLKTWMAWYSEMTSLWFDDAVLAQMTSVEASNHRLEVLIDHMQGLSAKAPLYAANLAYEFEHDLASLRVPTLILEVVTPGEEKLIGRQGPKLQEIIKDSSWVALDEPDIKRPTFQHRANDIGRVLMDFFA